MIKRKPAPKGKVKRKAPATVAKVRQKAKARSKGIDSSVPLDGKLILKNVRASFLKVITPRETTDDEGNVKKNYEICIIIKKKDPQAKLVDRMAKYFARAEFGQNVKFGRLKMIPRDGDEERDGEEFEDTVFFNARSKLKPGIINRYGQEPTQEELDELCVSGCYFNVSVKIFPYRHAAGNGVSAQLHNIMLWEEGERLDGHASASKDFEGMTEESPDDDFDASEFDDDIPF